MNESEAKSSGGLVLRRMEATDLPAVLETDALCLPRPWGEAGWRDELRSSFGLCLLLEKDGAVIGHIGVKLVADELHVTTLAVRPQHRRHGHARALFEGAIAESPEARHAYLEVRPSNAAARVLYGSLGFVEVGRRPHYYGNEDAVIMALELRV
ncbi:MAG: ribosomal protein S18-alanine N-acetyltransferase [Rubrobacter sp.]|nr:ribosomal protein S18-alanine N-acetyltransferase [Rubrobacter sp.]MBA3790194.1 ribosomal protein S18-alanine N-acetyltransferase [Rubrobacter sp.]